MARFSLKSDSAPPARPKKGDDVKVHYVGTLQTDGSRESRRREPNHAKTIMFARRVIYRADIKIPDPCVFREDQIIRQQVGGHHS